MSNLEDESTDSVYVLQLLNIYAMLIKKTANSEKFKKKIIRL